MSKKYKGGLDQYGAECFGAFVDLFLPQSVKTVGLKGLMVFLCCCICVTLYRDNDATLA